MENKKSGFRIKKRMWFITTFVLTMQFLQYTPANAQTDMRLSEVWETDSVLRTPESVAIDFKHNVIFVSNVNEGPWELDGNGFISKLDFNGDILVLKWAQGSMNGPKGMGILDDTLYVADIDAVIAIDTRDGRILKRIAADPNLQLNDINVSPDGTVFVSGSNSNQIFILDNNQLKLFADDNFDRPNGLLAEKNRLLTLTSGSGKLYEMGYKNPRKKELASGLGHGDGIASVGNESYLLSDWQGRVFFMDASGKVSTLLDTRAHEINAADITYLPEKQLLFVPTFYGNRVVAYKLSK